MPFRESPGAPVLSENVQAALRVLERADSPVRVRACDPERELHVVAHASLGTLAPPLVYAVLSLAGATLTAISGDVAVTIILAAIGLPFAKWGHYRWLCARRQEFRLIRGEGLFYLIPSMGLRSRRVQTAYSRVLGPRDGRVFGAQERLRYSVSRQGTDSEGRPRMVEDRSRITEVYVTCTATIGGKETWPLDVIASSRAVADRTVKALEEVFAAFAPALAADQRAAMIAEVEETTTVGTAARHQRLGNVYLLCKAWVEAELELVRATELDPAHSVAWNQLGMVRLSRDPPQTEAAIACFQRSIELTPSISSRHFNLATALRRAGRVADAVEALTHALTCAEAAKDDKEAASLRDTLAKWRAEVEKTVAK